MWTVVLCVDSVGCALLIALSWMSRWAQRSSLDSVNTAIGADWISIDPDHSNLLVWPHGPTSDHTSGEAFFFFPGVFEHRLNVLSMKGAIELDFPLACFWFIMTNVFIVCRLEIILVCIQKHNIQLAFKKDTKFLLQNP